MALFDGAASPGVAVGAGLFLDQLPGLLFELLVLRRPRRIERSVDHALQLLSALGFASGVEQKLGKKEVRGRALGVVGERFAEVLFREPAYAPPPLLKRMVLAGRMGKKSGQGFYKY